eukprot:CAMPEP_0184671640 /NCGR_PEP_ID=MMETSP0308-20130426/85623_1 /TAXON_ID=38269 /ORGANISM="Gloeochaete witrockiana, Strain SAG 46.84" /LENGTH=238 /DNA_ID=CAMNT_0027118811 /DNA_START=538 /DNA_END=1251 /DNA_ORIENTATION=+
MFFFTWSQYMVRDKRPLTRVREHRISHKELDFGHLGGTTEHLIKSRKIDYIVFGVGNWLHVAFYKENKIWTEPYVRRAFRKGIDRLNKLYKKGVLDAKVTRVIFRLVHLNHREPLKNSTCLHDEKTTFDREFLNSREFDNLFDQSMASVLVNNVLIEELHRRALRFQYFILDTQTVSRERWEAHTSSFRVDKKRDCLHWVLPGVPDTWSRIMFNAMCNPSSPDFWQTSVFCKQVGGRW